MENKKYMQRAIALAQKGEGYVSPNPLVGAVIVKNGRIIGEGYHEKYGSLHAERNALASCTESPEGADMYVTLEPCCHHGKQPPCTDAIIEAKIKNVYVGSPDPNPLVSGKGIRILREHGIHVTTDFLLEECNKINPVFFHYMKTKLPYVAIKYAMTMDGKIAASTGHSKWITSEAARHHVHQLRNKYSSIMVGIQTVLCDDPMLDCRIPNGRNPIRIICDTNLRTPLNSKIVTTAKNIPTIIATKSSDPDKYKAYLEAGCQILEINLQNGHIDFKDLLIQLGKQGIDSVLLEGGGTLHWSAFEIGAVNKLYTYIAPKIIGGKDSLSPVAGIGFPLMSSAIPLKNSVLSKFDQDFLIESEVEFSCSQE